MPPMPHVPRAVGLHLQKWPIGPRGLVLAFQVCEIPTVVCGNCQENLVIVL
jgi:hypothetical protein